ncbi:MAG: hypothetical protein ABR593_11985 [Candidatus Limnocylindria bacterium]
MEWYLFIIGLVVVVGVLLLLITLPDIVRYLRIRRM